MGSGETEYEKSYEEAKKLKLQVLADSNSPHVTSPHVTATVDSDETEYEKSYEEAKKLKLEVLAKSNSPHVTAHVKMFRHESENRHKEPFFYVGLLKGKYDPPPPPAPKIHAPKATYDLPQTLLSDLAKSILLEHRVVDLAAYNPTSQINPSTSVNWTQAQTELFQNLISQSPSTSSNLQPPILPMYMPPFFI